MKRAVVFDLDGTLWDTVQQLTDYWNLIRRRELGECRQITTAELRSWMGQGIRELAGSILPERDVDLWLETYLAALQGENEYLLQNGAALYPQLLPTLQALRSQGLELMICSNCGLGYIEAFLAYTKTGALFCDTENPGRTGLSKTENIRLLLQRNAIDAAIYVGDTISDQAAAQGAGVPFVHAAYGFGQVPEASHCIHALAELPDLTANWEESWPM